MTEDPEIPGYEIRNVLGKGGVATVYLGFQENLEREVAIKVLEPFFLGDEMTAARFIREAKIAAGLRHSNIIQIFDTGRAGEHYFIVMERLKESLRELMHRSSNHKINPEMALDTIEDILKALDYAHSRQIYHRDIKPANIMFRDDNTPVLVDFGIARVLHAPDHLTREGTSMGTAYYMSPEQCKSQEVDGQSDIYALGAVFYEMITGKKPYKGTNQMAIMLQHIKEPPPKLPEDLGRYQPLIDRMMAKDKKERIADKHQFDKVLYQILTNPHIFTPQPKGPLSPLKAEPTDPEGKEAPPPPKTTSSPYPASKDLIVHPRKKQEKRPESRFKIVENLFKAKLKKIIILVSAATLLVGIPIVYSICSSNYLKQKDNQAYQLAVEQNKIEGYQRYKKEFPKGRHFDEATLKINKLEVAALKEQKVLFRSKYQNLAVGDVKSMVIQHHFFDSEIERILQIYTYGFPFGIFNVDINPYTKGILKTIGTFKSYYEKIEKSGDSVTIDHTAGLMWYDGRSSDAMNIKNAERWIESLNIKEYGGYSDWRFPTLEEAASLLRKEKNKDKLHIDPDFSGYHESTWTKDTFSTKYNEDGEINMFWIIRFDSGKIQTSFSHIENRVWPVRSWEG